MGIEEVDRLCECTTVVGAPSISPNGWFHSVAINEMYAMFSVFWVNIEWLDREEIFDACNNNGDTPYCKKSIVTFLTWRGPHPTLSLTAIKCEILARWTFSWRRYCIYTTTNKCYCTAHLSADGGDIGWFLMSSPSIANHTYVFHSTQQQASTYLWCSIWPHHQYSSSSSSSSAIFAFGVVEEPRYWTFFWPKRFIPIDNISLRDCSTRLFITVSHR